MRMGRGDWRRAREEEQDCHSCSFKSRASERCAFKASKLLAELPVSFSSKDSLTKFGAPPLQAGAL